MSRLRQNKAIGREMSSRFVYDCEIPRRCRASGIRFAGMRIVLEIIFGYSPERINPGHDVHTIYNTTKIISGIDEMDYNGRIKNVVYGVFSSRMLQTCWSKYIEFINKSFGEEHKIKELDEEFTLLKKKYIEAVEKIQNESMGVKNG